MQRGYQHSEINFISTHGRCADGDVGLSLWHHAAASGGCCLACWLTVSECTPVSILGSCLVGDGVRIMYAWLTLHGFQAIKPCGFDTW
jgi:hypothetical protein